MSQKSLAMIEQEREEYMSLLSLPYALGLKYTSSYHGQPVMHPSCTDLCPEVTGLAIELYSRFCCLRYVRSLIIMLRFCCYTDVYGDRASAMLTMGAAAMHMSSRSVLVALQVATKMLSSKRYLSTRAAQHILA